MSFGWEDTSSKTYNWEEALQKVVDAGGTTIDLAVGRPEWLLSPEVPSDSGLTSSLSAAEGDPIAGIINTARAAGITSIYLTLDAMATTTLAKPEYQELRSLSLIHI